jgi:hypothetical protein
MQGMRRQKEEVNCVVMAEAAELRRQVAAMPIEDKTSLLAKDTGLWVKDIA